jgi:hypothetical protein
MLSLQQHPRNFLFEQPIAPGRPFRDACNWNHWVNRCFKRMFKRPVTANSLRHSYATSLDLDGMSPAQLDHAARRLAHTNSDTLKKYYLWGCFARRQPQP